MNFFNDIIKSQIRSVDIEFDSKKENIIGFKPTLIRDDEYFGEVEVFYDEVTVVVILKRINPVVVTSLAVEIVYQGCAEAGLCYPPITTSLAFDALP